jgi:hypothetical protein
MSTIKKKKVGSSGLGGWLILVGLGLILGSILSPVGLFGYIYLLLENIDIPGFKLVLQVNLILLSISFIADIYLLYLFFKKNKKFPFYYVISLWFMIAWAVIDYLMVTLLSAPPGELQMFLDEYIYETTKELVKISISSIIWILYMHRSERVKATFIR